MFPRPSSKERSEPAKHVATRPFDMDDLGAEFDQLCADVGLSDDYAGADDANAFERAECRNHRRGGGARQLLDPLRQSFSQFLDLIFILHQPRIVRHARCPPTSPISCVRRNDSERM